MSFHQQQHQIVLNQALYPVPCRYFNSPAGCMYGLSCDFQHIMDSNQYYQQHYQQTNQYSIPMCYSCPVSPIQMVPSIQPNDFSNIAMINIDISDEDENDNDDDIDNQNLAETVASKWLSPSKTISYGSRKHMKMQKYAIDAAKHQHQKRNKNGSEFAIMISASSRDLNGLYIQSGRRNGYLKYTECINRRASIHCNPKRGWTLSLDKAVRYFSYPLTASPPTLKSKWSCQGMDDLYDDKVPQIKTCHMLGYDLMDLLFVGFHREEEETLSWLMISTDIIHLFSEYFVECMTDRCDNCCRLCENLLLCGFQWLCQECMGQAMD